MSEKQKVKKEVLEYELAQMRMARKKSGDNPLRAIAIAEREVVLEAEIAKVEQGEAA